MMKCASHIRTEMATKLVDLLLLSATTDDFGNGIYVKCPHPCFTLSLIHNYGKI